VTALYILLTVILNFLYRSTIKSRNSFVASLI